MKLKMRGAGIRVVVVSECVCKEVEIHNQYVILQSDMLIGLKPVIKQVNSASLLTGGSII